VSVRTASVTFFSGTGNTRHACRLIASGLERTGWRVELREIAPPRPKVAGGRRSDREESAGGGPGAGMETGTVGGRADDPADAGLPDLAVLAFPVFAFGVPHIVRRFIRNLPAVDGTLAAVIAVFGDDFTGPPSDRRRVSGFEGGALDEAARLLSRRGYTVQTARGVGFPASFTQFMSPPAEAECRLLVAGSEAEIGRIAADLAGGRHELRRCGSATRVWAGAVRAAFSLVGRRALGKLYAADGRCTSCGWCERACPAGTIRMQGSGRLRRLPRWGWGCEACQRCINGCPEAAIQVSVFRILALVGAALLPYGRWMAAAAPGLLFPGSRFLAWLVGTLLVTLAVDQLLRLLERVPGVRRLVGMGYTRRFRRYRGPGVNGTGV
jgi:ferredoxin